MRSGTLPRPQTLSPFPEHRTPVLLVALFLLSIHHLDAVYLVSLFDVIHLLTFILSFLLPA